MVRQARERILLKIAEAIEARQTEILQENQADIEASKGKIDEHLMQRLVLKPQKLQNLMAGVRAIAAQKEPICEVSRRTGSLAVLFLNMAMSGSE